MTRQDVTLRLRAWLFSSVLVLLLPLSLAQSVANSASSSTDFHFTAPALQCSIITVAASDKDTAFVGTFFAADEGVASRCVAAAGPQVMVVASGGDPGATSSNLLVPTRVANTVNRRLLSIVENTRREPELLLSRILRGFLHLVNFPAPLLSHYSPPRSRWPITGLFEEQEVGSFRDDLKPGPVEDQAMLESTSGGRSEGAVPPEQGPLRGRAVSERSLDLSNGGPFFTCSILPARSWNVSSGPFPDAKTLPVSVVNGSFLLSAGCRNNARSTLFLYNRCKSDIPLVFQAYQATTEYCDLYNFQRYFSNTLFVRVIIMVGGVLACVLVVFSLGCLIGICRNRRLARARRRRTLTRLTDQLVASRGQTLLRFAAPRGRALEVPMYEVNLDPSWGGEEVQVVGKDGRALIVVIQPGMVENPSVETLAMSGAISIATEDVRHGSRSGGLGDVVSRETSRLGDVVGREPEGLRDLVLMVESRESSAGSSGSQGLPGGVPSVAMEMAQIREDERR